MLRDDGRMVNVKSSNQFNDNDSDLKIVFLTLQTVTWSVAHGDD